MDFIAFRWWSGSLSICISGSIMEEDSNLMAKCIGGV